MSCSIQVWTQTQSFSRLLFVRKWPKPCLRVCMFTSGLDTNSIFLCFLFVKNHWFAWRANQWITPHWGNTFSSAPPSNSLFSVSDPWRASWVDTAPFSGPRLASCVASRTTEIQGHCQVCRTRPRGPRTLSKTAYAYLDFAFVGKRTYSHWSLIVKSQQNRIELVTRPERPQNTFPPPPLLSSQSHGVRSHQVQPVQLCMLSHRPAIDARHPKPPLPGNSVVLPCTTARWHYNCN